VQKTPKAARSGLEGVSAQSARLRPWGWVFLGFYLIVDIIGII
jgi:hypothetical protein